MGTTLSTIKNQNSSSAESANKSLINKSKMANSATEQKTSSFFNLPTKIKQKKKDDELSAPLLPSPPRAPKTT